MGKVNFSMVLDNIKFNSRILLKGFVRTIYGALVDGLFAIAIYGFVFIKSESGYIAVFDFIASCATLTVAICNVYVMGGKKNGKRGKN